MLLDFSIIEASFKIKKKFEMSESHIEKLERLERELSEAKALISDYQKREAFLEKQIRDLESDK